MAMLNNQMIIFFNVPNDPMGQLKNHMDGQAGRPPSPCSPWKIGGISSSGMNAGNYDYIPPLNPLIPVVLHKAVAEVSKIGNL